MNISTWAACDCGWKVFIVFDEVESTDMKRQLEKRKYETMLSSGKYIVPHGADANNVLPTDRNGYAIVFSITWKLGTRLSMVLSAIMWLQFFTRQETTAERPKTDVSRTQKSLSRFCSTTKNAKQRKGEKTKSFATVLSHSRLTQNKEKSHLPNGILLSFARWLVQ